MSQIDTSEFALLDTKIGMTDEMNLQISVLWDHRAGMHRMIMRDGVTQNDAARCVTEGRDAEGRVPVLSFVAAMPEMVEEIIILNKLMGGAK